MNVNPLVSIITVSFNSDKTIERTIKSVINQTYKNIEYLIIDGKSSDSTVDIIKKYQKKFDKLKWISEADHGIYDAMNKGIYLAKGELIGIINSDDWYEVDTVETVVHEYIKHGDCIYYGILRMFKNEKLYNLKSYNHEFLSEQMIQHPTCFVPKVIYEKNGAFNLNYKISADYELMNRYKMNDISFFQIEKVLANFNMGGASSGSKGSFESLKIKNEFGYISNFYYILGIIKLIFRLLKKKIFKIISF